MVTRRRQLRSAAGSNTCCRIFYRLIIAASESLPFQKLLLLELALMTVSGVEGRFRPLPPLGEHLFR
jgi:hypothetical protein